MLTFQELIIHAKPRLPEEGNSFNNGETREFVVGIWRVETGEKDV